MIRPLKLHRAPARPGLSFFSVVAAIATLAFRVTAGSAQPVTGAIDNEHNVPSDVIARDFNGDGATDLAITFSFDDEIRWFFGRGDGRFVPGGFQPTGGQPGGANDLPRAMAAGDFDGDGFLDIAVVSSGNDRIALFFTPSLGVHYGTPLGGFEAFRPIALWPIEAPEPAFSATIEMGFVDEDSHLDLLVGHLDSQGVSLVRGRPGRAWREPILLEVETSGDGPVALKLVDLDSDGTAELIVANRNDLQVWRGDGLGGFPERSSFAEGSNFTAIELVDLYLDGSWDLIALEGSANTMRVFIALEPSGEFAEQLRLPLHGGTGPIDLVRLDANLDAHDDLALIYFTSGGGQVFLGRPFGSPSPLVPRRVFATSNLPRAIAAADLNGDLLSDLVIANEGDRNSGDSDNQDVVFDLNPLEPAKADSVAAIGPFSPQLALAPRLSRPRGLTWDPSRGSLWTIDRRRRLLARLAPDGEIRERISFAELGGADPAALIDPTDLAADGTGGLWIADRLSARVLHLDANLRVDGSFATAPAGVERPVSIAWDRARGLLYVSGEELERIVAFSIGGAREFAFFAPPARALAWNRDSEILFAITEPSPSTIVGFDLTVPIERPEATPAFTMAELAPLLAERRARSLAFDPATGRFWVLMESGLLLRVSDGGRITALRELRLFEEPAALALVPSGGVLVADSGLLGSVVRLDSEGRTVGGFIINRLEQARPVRIAGLTRMDGRIAVLDGPTGEVAVYSQQGDPLDRFDFDLPGRRFAGLHFDPAGPSLFIGAEGRLFQLPLDQGPTPPLTPSGPVVVHPIATTHPTSSISRGRHPEELALYSSERGSLSFLSLPFGIAPVAGLLQIVAQRRGLPTVFRPRAALALPDSPGDWVFAGSGEPVLLRFGIQGPPNAAGRGWARYR